MAKVKQLVKIDVAVVLVRDFEKTVQLHISTQEGKPSLLRTTLTHYQKMSQAGIDVINVYAKKNFKIERVNAEYLGVIGVHNKVENNIFLVEFLLVFKTDTNDIPFVNLNDFIEAFEESHPTMIEKVFTPWNNTNPNGLPSINKPSESEHNWSGNPRLDLVSFAIIINEKEEILMVIERTGKLFLPAGHIDPGENFLEGAIRETKEEAGVDSEVEYITEIRYGYGWGSNNYSPLHFIVKSKVTGGSVKTVKDKESNGARWISLKQAVEESRDPVKSNKYRKPWEIGPFMRNYLNHKTQIPIY